MRLFIAINFSGEVKGRLAEIQERLREYDPDADFSRVENLHLTLVFIGEVSENRALSLHRLMDTLDVAAFELKISGAGCFKRSGGDILWAGIRDESGRLSKLRGELVRRCLDEGFAVEDGEYSPHLTLARRVRMPGGFDYAAFSREVGDMSVGVTRVSLMKSERVRGVLTYTEIYGKDLERA